MISSVLGILIASDFLLNAAWGFIGPIFALFLTEQIAGGSIQMVGFAVAVYWITKSAIQPFLARFLDVTDGEKDDFWFLVAGMFAANLVPLGFLFATNMIHIFILQAVHGAAMAMVVPSWAAIFTRHISKGWEAFSWSIESTVLGFAAGLAAAFGGVLAGTLGFKAVFIIVAVFGLLSSALLLLVRNQVFSPNRVSQPLPPKEKLTH
ncbi:MAG: MFS transporter [Candidatus Wildermuthbacteria bacterium]|nr:MFS transporter [Candidatus Wildermuthbacteria bacterium]